MRTACRVAEGAALGAMLEARCPIEEVAAELRFRGGAVSAPRSARGLRSGPPAAQRPLNVAAACAENFASLPRAAGSPAVRRASAALPLELATIATVPTSTCRSWRTLRARVERRAFHTDDMPSPPRGSHAFKPNRSNRLQPQTARAPRRTIRSSLPRTGQTAPLARVRPTTVEAFYRDVPPSCEIENNSQISRLMMRDFPSFPRLRHA